MKLLVIAAFWLSLTIPALAMGGEGAINQEAECLGITGDPLALTAADIDELTDKQADGLAQVERQVWGVKGGIFEGIETKNSHEWLKKAMDRINHLTGTK